MSPLFGKLPAVAALAAAVGNEYFFGKVGHGEEVAKQNALQSGFTTVDNVEREGFGGSCWRKETGYEVTGTYYGVKTTKVVCVSFFDAQLQ